MKDKHLLFSMGLMVATGTTFSGLGWLYGLPVAAVLYGWVLTIFMVTLATLVRHLIVKRTTAKLERVVVTNDPTLKGLPGPLDPLEACYQQTLSTLINQNRQLKSDSDLNISELMAYYTLWVHQIKTPIAALDLMLQTMPDSEKKRMMQLERFKIEQYVEMALQMIRLDGESSDLVLTAQSLHKLASTTVKKYRSIFIEKQLSLVLDIPEDLMVLTDEKWVSVVLEQVISNALKYTNKGQIKIYAEGDGPFVLVIQDSGMGIEAHDLPRVFEKGFTGYNGRKDMRATGIGLFLAKRVCNLLGMKIQLTSEVAVGTKVFITFPVKDLSLKSSNGH